MKYKLAFISGATSGLGQALSYLLADKQIPLLLTGRDTAVLEQMKIAFEKKTPVEIFPADLTKEHDLIRLQAKMHQMVPDLIINAAGIGFYGDALSLSLEEQLSTVDINIKALLLIAIEGAKALASSGSTGTIMNISSAAACYTYPSFAVYAASKRFVKEFSLSFDLEMKEKGIRVLCALPGRFISSFHSKAIKGKKDNRSSLEVMSLHRVAQHILKQIKNKKGCAIIDFRYRLLYFLSWFMPKRFIGKILYNGTKKILRSYRDT